MCPSEMKITKDKEKTFKGARRTSSSLQRNNNANSNQLLSNNKDHTRMEWTMRCTCMDYEKENLKLDIKISHSLRVKAKIKTFSDKD